MPNLLCLAGYAVNFRGYAAVRKISLNRNSEIIIYVGIGVAKTTHYAAVKDDGDNVLVKPFAFDNDAQGFALLQEKLSAFGKDNLLIGFESTGIYTENPIRFLYESEYKQACHNQFYPNSRSAQDRGAQNQGGQIRYMSASLVMI